jgi:hypothetical protein
MRLIEKEVAVIRKLIALGVKLSRVAEIFDISERHARAIKSGQCWGGEPMQRRYMPLSTVQEIRQALAAGSRQVDIAAQFNVSQAQISRIKTNACWGKYK